MLTFKNLLKNDNYYGKMKNQKQNSNINKQKIVFLSIINL